jgi:hypothetical protein
VALGDGYGAYDEYRGFHVANGEGQPIHKRTDPTKLTSFYHDRTPSGKASTALIALLIPRLELDIDFVPVLVSQVGLSGPRPLADPFNRNSDVVGAISNYPVVFSDGSMLAACSGPAGFANAGDFLGRSEQAIILCLDRVTAAGTSNPVSAEKLLAIIVAHEYGHRLRLDHYVNWLAESSSSYQNGADALANVSSIGSSKYAMNSTDTTRLYLKLGYVKIGESGLLSFISVDSPDYGIYLDESKNGITAGFTEVENTLLDLGVNLNPMQFPPMQLLVEIKLDLTLTSSARVWSAHEGASLRTLPAHVVPGYS